MLDSYRLVCMDCMRRGCERCGNEATIRWRVSMWSVKIRLWVWCCAMGAKWPPPGRSCARGKGWMDTPGIEPGAFRLQSGRATTALCAHRQTTTNHTISSTQNAQTTQSTQSTQTTERNDYNTTQKRAQIHDTSPPPPPNVKTKTSH